MNLIIEKGSLFELKDTHILAHCISRDCALGAGIASQFRNYYPEIARDLSYYIKKTGTKRRCIMYSNVANLITKEKFFNKPTYEDLTEALYEFKQIIIIKKYKKIAIPKLGCRLDCLSWIKVRKIIIDIFSDLDIEIIVKVN